MNTIGRMRNVFGEQQREKIEDIKACEVTSEGQLVDANDKFLVVIYKKIKLSLLLLPSEEPESPYSTPRPMGDLERVQNISEDIKPLFANLNLIL